MSDESAEPDERFAILFELERMHKNKSIKFAFDLFFHIGLTLGIDSTYENYIADPVLIFFQIELHHTTCLPLGWQTL